MAATDEQITRVVDAYAASQASIITNLVRLLLALWIPFRWWGRPDMVNALAAASAAYADVGVEQSRRLARAYMIQVLEAVDAAPVDLPPFQPIYPRSGTPAVEVYKRPARQVEHAIREAARKAAENGTEPDPVEIAEIITERIEPIVDADLRAAARDEKHDVLQAAPAKVIGFRRVLHPELSENGPCGLCVVASDQWYTREDMLELHANCKCEVLPITADDDPGVRVNKADLKRIYAAAGSTYMEDLKRVGVKVTEHGELGPLLRWDGQHFKDVAEVNVQSQRTKFTPYDKPTKASDSINWEAQKATSERSIRILEDARRNGTNLIDILGNGDLIPVRDIDTAIEWHRSLIARAASRAA